MSTKDNTGAQSVNLAPKSPKSEDF